MSRLFILGAGGFAFEVALICDRLLQFGQASFSSYRFLDDNPEYARERGFADLVVGTIEDHQVEEDDRFVCAIGHPMQRRYVVEKFLKRGARFTNIIDPSAIVSEHAQLGTGIIVTAFGFISCFAKIGDHVHVNVSSSIGHDAEVGAFATLSAHVDLTGGVRAGTGSFFGTSAAVLPGHSIGDWARIGAGCTLARSVNREAIVYAEPPKFLDRGKS